MNNSKRRTLELRDRLILDRPSTQWIEEIEELVKRLKPRGRCIIISRFGIDEYSRPHTLQNLADELGVNREHIRQLQTRAMENLRCSAGVLQLDTFLCAFH